MSMDRWYSRRQVVQGAGAVGLGLLAGCGRLPGQAPSPTAVRVPRLGFLRGSDPTAQAQNVDLFRQALADRGYVEGQNLAIEYRWGEGSDARLAEPAAELARLPVDLFVVPSVTVARIVREATTTVPIVLAGTGGDPVTAGLAASYARPGGNVTGVTNLGLALTGKRLQLLKETVPSVSRVAVFWDTPTYGPFPVEDWSRDAQAVGVQLHPMALRGPEELDGAFEAAVWEGADSLLVSGGPLGNAHRAPIIQRAARLRWPAIYHQRQFVDEGGLLVYAASLADLWRRAVVYVDKILKGATPADLPIEQPQRFDFVINAKTAQALGLTIPHHVLLQATEILQ
jgi:putative tryptophan/tyrosine transport system substrate-binding protein